MTYNLKSNQQFLRYCHFDTDRVRFPLDSWHSKGNIDQCSLSSHLLNICLPYNDTCTMFLYNHISVFTMGALGLILVLALHQVAMLTNLMEMILRGVLSWFPRMPLKHRKSLTITRYVVVVVVVFCFLFLFFFLLLVRIWNMQYVKMQNVKSMQGFLRVIIMIRCSLTKCQFW